MLQAIYYKDERTPLLSDEINDLISSLTAYGFEDLRQDDILNCCCRYIGKNFYDSNIMEDLVKNDVTQHLDSIKSDVTKAVSFLHDECGVLSYKMLPYAKQLVGITNFFKEIKEPSESQIKELKKWFFYTTVRQSFQNSSLTAVRPLFRDLDKFIKGESQDAVEKYGNIQIPYLDFRFSTQSALSNLLMITLANIYVKRSAASDLTYIGQGKLLQDSPVGIFLFLNSQDKQIFSHIINGGDLDFTDFEKYALTQDMLKLLKEGNINDFKRQRDLLLVNAEKELLQQVGLLVE